MPKLPIKKMTNPKWPDNQAEIGYFAGMIDGEGCINIQKWSNPSGTCSYSTRFTIANTNLEVLLWIHERFGGAIYEQRRTGTYLNSKHKLCYIWITAGAKGNWLLERVTPYLVIKPQQAALAVQIGSLHLLAKDRHKQIDPRSQRKAEQLKAKIHELNRRGVPDVEEA